MFILTPTAINSSLTSKWAHECSLIVIVSSLAVSWDSLSFFSDCSVRISKRYREREEIVASISLSTCETNLSLPNHCNINQTGESVREWGPKVVSQFHNDPTVNNSMIVVLLGHIWVYAGKEKAQCGRYFFYHNN